MLRTRLEDHRKKNVNKADRDGVPIPFVSEPRCRDAMLAASGRAQSILCGTLMPVYTAKSVLGVIVIYGSIKTSQGTETSCVAVLRRKD